MPLLARLYVWSIVFEPLIYFTLFSQGVTGVGGNLGRLLQFFVLVGTVLRLALATGSRTARIRFVRLASPLYNNYRTYFVLAIVAGIIGAASGAFSVAESYETGASAVSGFINSAAIRPVFEYLIAAYYFVYFTILPQYFLTSRRSIDYFFRAFRMMFIASLVIGTIDLAMLSLTGSPLLTRVLIEDTTVGVRFHGFAGEPRDAFIYLFFGLAVFYLQAFYRGERLNRLWIAVVVSAAVLTQSASGLLGLLFFIGLYALYTLPVMGPKRIIQLLVVSTLVAVVVYQATINSDRLMLYVKDADASVIWSTLERGLPVLGTIGQQANNIYPLYDLVVKARDFNFLPVLIGSGLGSASVVSIHYAGATFAAVSNPHSQLVRTLYESGIIGTIFFAKAFTRPVKHLTRHLSAKQRNGFLMVTLLLLGLFFAHRSATAFIYVGIVIAVFRYLDQESTTRASSRSPVPAPGRDMAPAA